MMSLDESRFAMRGAVIAPPLTKQSMWCVASVTLVFGAFAVQAYLGHNPDTSWLLFVARRTLDGAIPYRDILETNPPASFLLYMPVVILARLLGANEVAVLDGFVVFATAASLLLSGLIFARGTLLEGSRVGASLFAALLVLLILPMSSFAQREHIAVLADLPILAAIGVRSRGGRPSPTSCLLAGLGAGIAIAIKPLFALALALSLLCCFLAPARPRPWRFVELWTAAATALVYAAVVILVYPDFTARMLPLVTEIYLPARLDLVDLLALQTNFIWLALVGLFWGARGWRDTVGLALMTASVGFEAAVFIQGKGFTYHGYPAIALAAIACANVLVHPAAPADFRRLRQPLVAAAVLMVGLAGLWVFDERYDVEAHSPGLTRAIEMASDHPRLLTIGSKIALDESFARHIDAQWVGSEPVAWITYFAIAREAEPKEPPRYATAIDRERSRYASDIRENKPDVVLVDGDWWMRWTRRSPTLIEALSHYREAGQFGRVSVLQRMPDGALDHDVAADESRPPEK